MKPRSIIMCALIVLPFIGSAQIVWKKSGGTKTFTKPSNADWTAAVNQDRMSDSVWLTRASSQSLFNIRKESGYQTGAPKGTTWAFGTTDSYSSLNYKTFVVLNGNNPQSLIGKDLVLHLVAENVYLDIKFLSWGNGPSGAGFSYVRADGILPVELTAFSAVSNGASVRLMWRTATEVNNHGFEIERKLSKLQNSLWEKSGFVEGSGTSNAPKEYSYTDNNLMVGKYSYRLKQIDRDGSFSYSPTVEVIISGALTVFALEQNYPNPFNPTTTISYQLPAVGQTTVIVYDAIGREAATLVNEVKEAGTYSVPFDGSKLSSGIYFIKLTSGGKTQMRKMSLIK